MNGTVHIPFEPRWLVAACALALGCGGNEATPSHGGTGATGGGAGAGAAGMPASAGGMPGGAGTSAGMPGSVAGTGGTSGTGGALAGAGGTGGAAAGTGGTTGGAGTGTGGVATGGAGAGATAGSGGSAGNAAGGMPNAAGAAGASGQGAGGAGAAGAAGSGGSGGAMDCKGNALNLGSNVPGGSDPAKSRVMVDFMSSTDLPLANGNRTIEFWAYTLTSSWAGENNTIFEYGDQSTGNAGFGLDFGGTSATMDPYTNGSCDNDNQASGVMEADQWVHFAMTYDGSAVRLYVNGVQHSNKTCAMLATAKTALSIGGNPRGSYFNGKLDEFRVWNVARTADEIMSTMSKTLVGNETGLVAYYNFNETTGTKAADSVTTAAHTAHDGTLMATMTDQLPTFVPSDAPISCP